MRKRVVYGVEFGIVEEVGTCGRYSKAELGKEHMRNNGVQFGALERMLVLCRMFFPICLRDGPIMCCCITTFLKT